MQDKFYVINSRVRKFSNTQYVKSSFCCAKVKPSPRRRAVYLVLLHFILTSSKTPTDSISQFPILRVSTTGFVKLVNENANWPKLPSNPTLDSNDANQTYYTRDVQVSKINPSNLNAPASFIVPDLSPTYGLIVSRR